MCTIARALLFLILSIATTLQASAQSKPEFYGVYAQIDGTLQKLEGKPISALGSFFGASGIIKHGPTTTFKSGNLRFVVYRRELTVSAPESVFVNIVARAVREKAYGMNGQITKDEPIFGIWVMRERGYKFSVAPYLDSKEMILVRHENSNFILPVGRYGFIFGDQYYDFLVNQDSDDLEHCVEWVGRATGMSVTFPRCDLPQKAQPERPVINPAAAKVAERYEVDRPSSIVGQLITSTNIEMNAARPDDGVATCARICDQTSNCRAFDVSLVYNKCSLYKDVTRKSSLGGYISGVRKN